jgi:hypothetical protein
LQTLACVQFGFLVAFSSCLVAFSTFPACFTGLSVPLQMCGVGGAYTGCGVSLEPGVKLSRRPKVVQSRLLRRIDSKGSISTTVVAALRLA